MRGDRIQFYENERKSDSISDFLSFGVICSTNSGAFRFHSGSEEGTMSHTNRNFVVAYVLLVGLPLLGLAGVLKSGRSLVAPISVDGTWKIEAGASHVGSPSASQSCDKTVASLAAGSLGISQSGKSLVLTFNGGSKAVASGALEGKNLSASFVPSRDASSDNHCGDQPITLAATIDPQVEPRSLSGVLSVNGCASCVPLEFRAVRQPRAPSGGMR